MQKIVHKARERGAGNYGWLSTRYSFSFADWYNPEKMGFGALRVMNDDTIAPASGFPMHSHKNMEIVTIVTAGTLTHKDSMGNIGTLTAGGVQAMSAGTGITHSEYNASDTEPLTLFQIWITPKELGLRAEYAQKSFENKNGLILLVSPNTEQGTLAINQDAYIYSGVLDKENPIHYVLNKKENGIYVFVVEGVITLCDETLFSRDTIGILNMKEEIIIEAEKATKILIIEVPITKA